MKKISLAIILVIFSISIAHNEGNDYLCQYTVSIPEPEPVEKLEPIRAQVVATVYYPVVAQCDADPLVTATST